MAEVKQIKRAYTRLYRDSGQLCAYVDFTDGSRLEGMAEMYHGVRVPRGAHMGALFDRAMREGKTVEHETW